MSFALITFNLVINFSASQRGISISARMAGGGGVLRTGRWAGGARSGRTLDAFSSVGLARSVRATVDRSAIPTTTNDSVAAATIERTVSLSSAAMTQYP